MGDRDELAMVDWPKISRPVMSIYASAFIWINADMYGGMRNEQNRNTCETDT